MKPITLRCLAAIILAACGGSSGGEDPETQAIIDRWIEAWKAEDVVGIVDLYAEDGVYADTGCPFEMRGRRAIMSMAMGHLSAADYTLVDPVSIDYTETGAVVQWVWGGTYNGRPFTMDSSTTFEIADGVIVRSTDSYERADTPPAWEAACIRYEAGRQ